MKKENRQVRWAREKRAWLIRVLGGVCAHCGVAVCLTFDCKKATGDKHHRMSSTQRMSFYLGQARRGNLQLLCSACNSKKGAKLEPRYRAKAEVLGSKEKVMGNSCSTSMCIEEGGAFGEEAVRSKK